MRKSIFEHLNSRGCNPNKYHCFISDEAATFLLFNLSGQIVGFQQYRPNAPKDAKGNRKELRYWSYVGQEGETKRIAVFGLETLEIKNGFCFIVEGIFDAVKVHNAGYPCIATLSNDPNHLTTLFKDLGRLFISISDNDKAGNRLKKFAKLNLDVPKKFKDIGDMPQPEANILIQSFLYSNNLI